MSIVLTQEQLDSQILSPSGAPIPFEVVNPVWDGTSKTPASKLILLTYREAMIQALNAPKMSQSGNQRTTEQSLQDYRLIRTLSRKKQIEFTSAEVVHIMTEVNRVFGSPWIYGRVWDILEGHSDS